MSEVKKRKVIKKYLPRHREKVLFAGVSATRFLVERKKERIDNCIDHVLAGSRSHRDKIRILTPNSIFGVKEASGIFFREEIISELVFEITWNAKGFQFI